MYPERVTWSEAAATCKQLPGGQLAILDSQALIDKVSRDLLDTLPFQTAVRSAWVGATGNNTAFNPAAATISDLAGNTSEGNGRLQARLPPRKELTTPPETTLRWTGGTQVAPGLLRRPDSLTQLWTVHDVVWSQQYVPESSKDVCGRVMVQLPPSTGPVNPASVLPGMWYYDCDKPAAFICQSECLASVGCVCEFADCIADSCTPASVGCRRLPRLPCQIVGPHVHVQCSGWCMQPHSRGHSSVQVCVSAYADDMRALCIFLCACRLVRSD